MKRLLSAILASLLLIQPVYAEPDAVSEENSEMPSRMILFFDHDNDFSGRHGDWYVQNRDSDDIVEVREVDGNKALYVSTGPTGGDRAVMMEGGFITGYEFDDLVISFKFRREDNGAKVFRGADYTSNADWKRVVFFTIDNDGFVNIAGKPICYLPLREFHQFDICIDHKAKNYDFYFDGKLMTTASLDKGFRYLGSFFFNVSKYNDEESSIYIDDFAMYESDKPLARDAVYKKYVQLRQGGGANPMREELCEFAKGYSLFAAEARYAFYNDERHELPIRLYEENGLVYAPIRMVSEALGAKVSYNNGIATVTKGDKELVFEIDSGYMKIGGKNIKLPSLVRLKDGSMFVSADELFQEFGTVYKDEVNNFYAIGENDFSDKFTIRIDSREMYYYIVYEKPTWQEILADYNKTTKEGQHPRVFYTPESVEKLKGYIKTDPDMKKWYDESIKKADSHIGASDIIMQVSADALNTTFSPSIVIFTDLAWAYMFTGDRKYGDELWRQMQSFMKFEHLNLARSALNGGACASCVAQAYDWAYDYFTPEQRKQIEDALESFFVNPWTRAFQQLAFFPQAANADRAIDNVKCVETAQFMPACLVLFDNDPEFYAKMLEASFRAMEYYLPNYAPDGGYYEGPLYWNYATSNLVAFFEAAEICLGNLYGYYDVFNINNTGAFPLYMSGGSLVFNFADSERSTLYPSMGVSYYFAKKNNDPEFAAIIIDIMRKVGASVGNRWYEPGFHSEIVKEYPLDDYFRVVEAGSMRERWGDTGAAYLGYRGGTNAGGHDQYDKGTFVFDAGGERWAEDLGRDNYSLPDFWSYPTRFTYYMNRGEGHNVVLVNPKGRVEDQVHGASAYRIASESKKGGAYNVLDTTALYRADEVSKAQRGFMLTDSRKMAVIRDEIEIKKNGTDIWWFMHTGAEIRILDGGRRAILSQNGKECIVELNCSNKDAKFIEMAAEHLEESPKPAEAYITKIKNYKKLAVNTTADAGHFNITVNMRAVDVDAMEEFKFLDEFSPISEWTVNDSTTDMSALLELCVDGKLIENFSSMESSYSLNVERGSRPQISVKVKPGYEATLHQIDTLPGVAWALITNTQNPDERFTVKVNFKIPLYEGIPDNMEAIEIKDFKATPETIGKWDAEGKNVFDGDMVSYWATEGASELWVDLGEVKEFDGVSTAFYLGHQRINFYTIEISEDNKSFKTIFNGETTGTTEDFMTVFCEGTRARYIRLNFSRTSTGVWNSVKELRIIKNK